MNRSAIIGYGMYVPSERITTEEIAKHWNREPGVSRGLGVTQKSVPRPDEDTFTMAHEAARNALEMSNLRSTEISAVFVGSESHPYAVKPTSGMLADALGVDPFCHCADLEFACKAGTAGMQIVDAFVRSKQIKYGLAIGSDTAQSKPGDALEYTAAAGAAAMIIGRDTDKNAICRIDNTLSFTTDTPDFWRSSGSEHPEHAGRFTGEPGYFSHVRTTLKAMLDTRSVNIEDIDHVVLHMPNGKFPSKIAKEFGITPDQMQHGFIVPEIGNTYSACSMLGLTHAIEAAKQDETILVVSYGSGAGCDAFFMTMLKDGLSMKRPTGEESELDYAAYTQRMGMRA